MLRLYFVSLILYRLVCEGGYENPEFDKSIREFVKTRGGDPKILHTFVDGGIPKGLKKEDFKNPPYCSNILTPSVIDEKYSECTTLAAPNGSIVFITNWSGFNIFEFSVNLVELKNVELQMTYRKDIVYLYFTAFRKCDNCLFNITKNPGLIGIRFSYLMNNVNFTTIPKKYLPAIIVRGNPRLKLRKSNNMRKNTHLGILCKSKVCDVQYKKECFFPFPITSSRVYKYCSRVYGDMHFTSTFQENRPADMNFVIDGCFVFNRTGIQYIRPILKALANCSRQHIFEHNKYMCTDQLKEIEMYWGKEKLKIISKAKPAMCHQGECRGGFVSEAAVDRYSGCEIVQGNIYISEHSGNLSERIQDLSYIHVIYGQVRLANNPSITNLALPFLEKIESEKCPALFISNMKNLKTILFHSLVTFNCTGPAPAVIIKNSSEVYLHRHMLRQMRKVNAVLLDFDSNTDAYFKTELITFYLIGGSFAIVIFMEIVCLLRKNLLLPNFFYRLFPMGAHRQLKQKQVKIKKNE